MLMGACKNLLPKYDTMGACKRNKTITHTLSSFGTSRRPGWISIVDNRSAHVPLMTRLCTNVRTRMWMCTHVWCDLTQGRVHIPLF